MSWDSWTENLEKQNVHHCAIFGRDGNPWSCKNMQASQNEIKTIEEAIRTKDQSIFANGATLNNEKWTAIRMEDNVLVIKGKGESKDKTMTCCLTKSAVVLGCNKDANTQANHVRDATEKLAGQLEAAGY